MKLLDINSLIKIMKMEMVVEVVVVVDILVEVELGGIGDDSNQYGSGGGGGSTIIYNNSYFDGGSFTDETADIGSELKYRQINLNKE